MTHSSGIAVIISGPSGVGKGTVIKSLLHSIKDFELSVSHTTRKPRTGESNGKDYHFISLEEYERKKSQGEFAESAEVHGNYYGTSADYISEIESGKKILFEIDVQGAKNLIDFFKKNNVNVLSIFLKPPCMETLLERLDKRGTETPETFKIRMKNATRELEDSMYFDKSVINDKIDETVSIIADIIQRSE